MKPYLYRFTWLRRCDVCGRFVHLSRPVNFGVDVEDVCISCMVRKGYRPDVRFLKREESFVVVGLALAFLMVGVRAGLEIAFYLIGGGK